MRGRTGSGSLDMGIGGYGMKRINSYGRGKNIDYVTASVRLCSLPISRWRHGKIYISCVPTSFSIERFGAAPVPLDSTHGVLLRQV